jgi:predicted  nucleic acid-binding Zn-ribbon protein
MFLERLVQNVEERMLALGRQLWRTDPQMKLREDVQHVSHDLRDRREALNRARTEIDALRKRITENQVAAAGLKARVGTALTRGAADEAWRDALDLDRTHRELADDQAALPKQEKLAATIELQVRFLTRRLARLQDQLYPSA